MKQAKALVTIEGLLTINRIYTILSEVLDPAKRLHYSVIDDRGVQCVYQASRFEVVLAPQVAPNFSEMQQIASEVKITCPVVEDYEARKAATNNFLLERLNARREQALSDSDANLAALLFDVMAVLKRADCVIPDGAYQCEGCDCEGDE